MQIKESQAGNSRVYTYSIFISEHKCSSLCANLGEGCMFLKGPTVVAPLQECSRQCDFVMLLGCAWHIFHMFTCGTHILEIRENYKKPPHYRQWFQKTTTIRKNFKKSPVYR
jgi:hypothetical protein